MSELRKKYYKQYYIHVNIYHCNVNTLENYFISVTKNENNEIVSLNQRHKEVLERNYVENNIEKLNIMKKLENIRIHSTNMKGISDKNDINYEQTIKCIEDLDTDIVMFNKTNTKQNTRTVIQIERKLRRISIAV